MWKLVAAFGVMLVLGGHPSKVAAACSGDCDGDGAVTVNELVLGVNIALGSTAIGLCPSFDAEGDGEVTINELITAVSSALNGCLAYVGHYQSTVTLAGGQSGAMDLMVHPDGTATGGLVISADGALALARAAFGAAVVIANVSLSGSVDFDTGQFSIAGSYVDALGNTVPINVSGSLPSQINGVGVVNFQIGSNTFPSTITAAANTPTPTATPGPGTTHIVKVGQPTLPFDPELVVINVGDTVTWTWVAGMHSVQSGPNYFPPTCEADGIFDSGPRSSGTFSYTFTTPGNYGFHCGVAGHCANFESGEVQVIGTPVPTATYTPKPTATSIPTFTPTATPTPSTIGGVSTAMLGLFSGTAHNMQFGNTFKALVEISADASAATVTDRQTSDGYALGAGTFKMIVESPTRLSFSDPNPSNMISLVLELTGPGHVTGSYSLVSPMYNYALALDLMRLP
jgi:plastocyanin